MQNQDMNQSTDYAQAIAKLVTSMPVERAAQVYDFVCFLLSPPNPIPLEKLDNEDWLNDSEEQMLAEDALWDATYARHRDKFEALAEAARAEIAMDMAN